MGEKKDWVGGRASVFKTLGASNHTDHERAWGDYYATEPKATEWLLRLEKFDGPILEPACGEGHISKVLIRGGIPLLRETSSIEVMEKWPTFWLSTICNGTGTSLQTRLMPMHKSLWRKHCRLSQRGKRCACFSNLPFWRGEGESTCSGHSLRHEYGSVHRDCYVP